jgi:WD40 repeat protein
MTHTRELLTTPRKIAEIKDFGIGSNLIYSPDGKLLACSNELGEIGVWDAKNGNALHTIRHAENIEALAFSPDSKLLASGCYYGDNTARIWEVDSGKEIASLEHDDNVQILVFDPSGKILTTGGDESDIYIWETSTWQKKNSIPLSDNLVASIYHPKKPHLYAGSVDGTISVWDYNSGKKLASLDNKATFNYLIISADGSMIATKEFMGLVNLWETENWKKTTEIYEPTISLAGQAMDFGPDGNVLALGYGEFETYGGIRIYSTKTGQLTNNIYRSKAVGTLSFSPDGKWLGAGGGDYIAGSRAPSKSWIFKASTGEQLAWVQCQGTVWQITFNPDGRSFATRDDEIIHIWQLFP